MNLVQELAGKKITAAAAAARYGRLGEPSLPIFFEKTHRPRLRLSWETIKSQLDRNFHTGIFIP